MTCNNVKATSESKVPFNGNVFFCGYGAVARCTLPLIVKHINVPFDRITVIDFEDKTEELKPFMEKGLKYHTIRIDKENITSVLSQFVHRGDLLIDLAWEIDTLTFLEWCYDNGVMYINASVEEWEPYGKTDTYKQTLYYRHMRMREVISKWVDSETKQKKGKYNII